MDFTCFKLESVKLLNGDKAVIQIRSFPDDRYRWTPSISNRIKARAAVSWKMRHIIFWLKLSSVRCTSVHKLTSSFCLVIGSLTKDRSSCFIHMHFASLLRINYCLVIWKYLGRPAPQTSANFHQQQTKHDIENTTGLKNYPLIYPSNHPFCKNKILKFKLVKVSLPWTTSMCDHHCLIFW